MLFPIFIIGCARSGTSIFGEFFEYNSKCQYFFDEDIWDPAFDNSLKKLRSKFIRNTNLSANLKLRKILQTTSEKISDKSDNDQRLTEQDTSEPYNKQAMDMLHRYPEKHLVIHGPKHSLRIPFILKIYPDARFLHIVRDGRDVVCSLKKGMEDDLWVHHKPPGWKKWLSKSVHIKCAWLWNTTIEIIKIKRTKK